MQDNHIPHENQGESPVSPDICCSVVDPEVVEVVQVSDGTSTAIIAANDPRGVDPSGSLIDYPGLMTTAIRGIATDIEECDSVVALFRRRHPVVQNYELRDGARVVIEREGVFMEEQVGSKGKIKVSELSQFPVVAVALVVPYDAEDGSNDLVLLEGVGLDKRPWQKLVSFAALNNPDISAYRKELGKLAKVGLPIFNKAGSNKIPLARYIARVVKQMRDNDAIKIIPGALRCGWHVVDLHKMLAVEGASSCVAPAHRGITPSRAFHILPGSPLYAGCESSVISPKGDYEEWRKAVLDAVEEISGKQASSPIAKIVMGFAAGSLLREWIKGVETKILHLGGKTSRGKSLACKLAISMLGAFTNSLIYNSWATSVPAFRATAPNFQHAFMVFDESHSMEGDTETRRKFIMSIGNDVMAGRATADGGIRDRKDWNLSILSTGNDMLTTVGNKSAQDEAIKARVLEIAIGKNHESVFGWDHPTTADELDNLLRLNHGHLYPMLIEKIIANNEKYVGIYKEVYGKVADWAAEIGADASYISRRIQGWCLARAGLELLHDTMGMRIDDAVAKLDELIEQEKGDGKPDKVEDVAEVMADVRAFVLENLNQASVEGYWWTPSGAPKDRENYDHDESWAAVQELRAKDLSQKGGSVSIKVHQPHIMQSEGELTGRVEIRQTGKYKGQIDLTSLALRADSLDIGLLVRGEGRNLARKTRTLGRAYTFDLSKGLDFEAELMRREALAEEAALAAQPAPPADAPF